MRALLASCLLAALLTGCTGIPEGVQPVEPFRIDAYLGRWYEIARLDHSFEEGLSQVTADYSLQDDGSIRVVNRGFNDQTGEWEEAVGKAYPVDDPTRGHLKVSFFGPFYASYVIFELGENYDYAYVSGPDKDYLWLLARSSQVTPERLNDFRQQAQAAGFNLQELLVVEHPEN
nr:lipocalin family protein [Marinospirillum perlucidum]